MRRLTPSNPSAAPAAALPPALPAARWHPALVRPDLVDGWSDAPEQAEFPLDAIPRALVVRPVLTSPGPPGLGLQTPLGVAAAAVRAAGPWSVVHLPSGRLVVRALHDLGLAKHTARQLARCTDWAARATDLLRRFERAPALRARVRAVRDRAYAEDVALLEARRLARRTAPLAPPHPAAARQAA